MLKRIVKVWNFCRPVRVHSLDVFVVRLKHLGCTSVTGDISVTTGRRNHKRIDIHLSSRAPNGRSVIWKRSGIKQAEEDVAAVCGRSLLVLQGNMETIRRRVPGVATVIVDWEGSRWTRSKDEQLTKT